MQHGTCRGAKIKAIRGAVSLAGRLKHNLREKEVLNARGDQKDSNQVLIGLDSVNGICTAAAVKLDRVTGKINKNAILAIEFVVTLTSDSLVKNGGKMTPEKVDKYLSDGLKHLKNRFGENTIISAIRHNDEEVPHLHVILVPLKDIKKEVKRVVSVDEKGKKTFENTGIFKEKTVLNSQDFFGDRTTLSKFQQEYYDDVSKKYGLERGEIGGKTLTRRSDIDKALSKREKNVEFKENILDKKEEKLGVEYAKYLDDISKLEGERKAFEKEMDALEKRGKALDKQTEKVLEREKTVTDRERSATASEKDLTAQEEKLVVLEGQAKEFIKAKQTQLRGWEMPDPKFGETAKKYRERVEPEVSGRVVRALKVVDENAFNVKYVKDEADRTIGQQEGYTEMYKNQWQNAVKSADKYKAQYSELKSQILKAKSVDEINSIKEALTPKPTRDMGYER